MSQNVILGEVGLVLKACQCKNAFCYPNAKRLFVTPMQKGICYPDAKGFCYPKQPEETAAATCFRDKLCLLEAVLESLICKKSGPLRRHCQPVDQHSYNGDSV